MKKGWELKKLGEVAKIIYGYTEKASFEEVGPKFLRITDIQDDGVNWDTVPFCKINDADFDKYKLSDGDIVFARTGATTGKSYLVNDPPKSVFASYLIKVHINSRNLTPQYLFQFFQTKEYWDVISAGVAGAAQGGFNATKLSDLEIPLPPLPEQQRIVAILDEAFSAVAKAKANAEQNLKNAKELFESYLQRVFENGNWEEKTIEQVCDEIFAGGDAPRNNYSLEKNDEYQIPIYANALKDRGLYGYTNTARVTKPSITIAARGSGTGHTEIRFEDYLPIVRLIVLIPNLSIINLEFLKHSIDTLEILRSGSAIPQLTVPMIKEYKLPLPTLAEQQSIVQKLDALSAQTKKLEAIYQQKINDLEELKKSILQKAFAGELKTVEALAL